MSENPRFDAAEMEDSGNEGPEPFLFCAVQGRDLCAPFGRWPDICPIRTKGAERQNFAVGLGVDLDEHGHREKPLGFNPGGWHRAGLD